MIAGGQGELWAVPGALRHGWCSNAVNVRKIPVYRAVLPRPTIEKVKDVQDSIAGADAAEG